MSRRDPAPSEHARKKRLHVLYLHGRGSTPSDPPGDLLQASSDKFDLIAPRLGGEWLARDFADQVADVGGWLDGVDLAVGHSFGAWLLLCAAEERMRASSPIPPLMLLSPILGASRLGGLGLVAPRARRIRAALGIEPRAGATPFPNDRIVIIHAVDDPQCPGEELRRLAPRYQVRAVSGGHRLEDPVSRSRIAGLLAEAAPA